MLTIIASIASGIILWFDAFKAMNSMPVPPGGHWSTLVYYITKYMRYPFIAMLIDMIITCILIFIANDDPTFIQSILWNLGIY